MSPDSASCSMRGSIGVCGGGSSSSRAASATGSGTATGTATGAVRAGRGADGDRLLVVGQRHVEGVRAVARPPSGVTSSGSTRAAALRRRRRSSRSLSTGES